MSVGRAAPVARSDRTRGLTTQAIMLSGGMAFSQGLFALAFIFAARRSVPSDFGYVSVTIAIGLFVQGAADMGITPYVIRQGAKGSEDWGHIASRLVSKAAYVGVFALAWLAISPWVNFHCQGAFVAVAATYSQSALVPLRALAKAERAAVVMIVDRCVMLGAFFGLLPVVGPSDSLWIGVLVGNCVSGTLAVVVTPRAARSARVRFIKNPWRGATSYGIFMWAIAAQSQDLTVLSGVSGAGAAGQYAAVNRWISPLGLLGNAFSSAAVPFLANAETFRQAWLAIRRSAWILALGALGCLAVALFAGRITALLLGSAYQDSADVLRFLALGALIALVNQPMASFLMTSGRDVAVARITAGSVGLQLGGVALLASKLGPQAAGIMFFIAQICLLMGYFILVVRVERCGSWREPGGVAAGARRRSKNAD